MLKLSKLENQPIFPQAQGFNLGEQLCEALLQYENLWEKEHIEIEADIAEDITICADKELLSLVWSNLLSNAFKFTPPGGRWACGWQQVGMGGCYRVGYRLRHVCRNREPYL